MIKFFVVSMASTILLVATMMIFTADFNGHLALGYFFLVLSIALNLYWFYLFYKGLIAVARMFNPDFLKKE